MVWQTYDYYFDPNAAYFGCKKASEPLHIQWNPLRDDIEVVNYHAFDRTGLTATASLFNQDGTLQWTRETKLDIKEDQTVACFPLEQPETLSDTYFIKLSLTDSDGKPSCPTTSIGGVRKMVITSLCYSFQKCRYAKMLP